MKHKKYAVLADVHANSEALEAVLADAQAEDVTGYVCVGDIVGYNASPKECLEKIREICSAIVRGNHDHYCAHDECLEDFHPLAANVVDWTRRHLSEEQVTFLKDLKLSKKVGGFTIVHSTLDMPHKWGYVFDPLEADANFNYQMTSVCFHGHTHVPVAYIKEDRVRREEYKKLKIELGKKYFINVGSVGQPRDGDPRSSYAIYDVSERVVELRRVEYDIAAAQAKIREAGLPEKLAKRLEFGK
jgi:diadenosine tetraphosphatase ApaH/serine/threonine PP2A family protein phosphatase